MPAGQISSTISVGGLEFSSSISKTASGQIGHEVTLPAGTAGLKSATGVDNLVTGHGYTAAMIVDVHWTDTTDGVTHKVRRGLTIDTASANAITFDETPAGEGDALPANGTAVVIDQQVVLDTDFDGDLIEMIAVKSDQRAMADFRTAAASLRPHYLGANQAQTWVVGQGVANPYTGTPIDTIKMTNGSAVAAKISIGVLYRSA